MEIVVERLAKEVEVVVVDMGVAVLVVGKKVKGNWY